MTEAAAKPGLAGARRWRSRASASRLVQYILLQALIVIVCIFALRQPASEPPSRYLVTTFSLKDNGAERSVTLPDFVAIQLSTPAASRGRTASRNARGRCICRALPMASKLPSTTS